VAEAENARHNRQLLERLIGLLRQQVAKAERDKDWGEFGVLFQVRGGKITMIRETAQRTETV